LKADPVIQRYYETLEKKAREEYSIAKEARMKGYDPSQNVEIAFAKDVYARVEGLVGPTGVAADMRRIMAETGSRETTALRTVDLIIEGKYGEMDENETAEQCIRTALALLTEGVVAAPIEGISGAEVKENPDGSRYLTVGFAGPIRSAGGTAQALAVLIADYTRQKMGLDEYRPTKTEVERYVEEINLYHNAVSRLQYKPTDDEIRTIVTNCPVCVSGEPTSDVEVDVYKDLDRIPTNRIRGGMCLVISEGIAQKAQKVLKYAKLFGLNWDWLSSIVKVGAKGGKTEIKPVDTYMKEIVAGRPILSYPSTPGGFRLRYGRTRNSGLMAKGMHPATMVVLGGFPAIGTQLKVERPGKGMTVVPCDTIEGPVVKLRNGDVIILDSEEQARELYSQIDEILFNGDLLISFGDFLHSNHPIVQSPWVEEWWVQELEERGGRCKNPFNVSFDEAVRYSKEYGVPLHPKFVFPYNDVSIDELKRLMRWLSTDMKNSDEKRILELLLVPHHVEENHIVIEEWARKALFKTLDIPYSLSKIDNITAEDTLSFVNKLSPFIIMDKAPVYIGARMGRPEKAKERLMSPAPHVLFPVGTYGGSTRSIMKAAEGGTIQVEITRLKCPKCNVIVNGYKCDRCGSRTVVEYICQRCGIPSEDFCPKCGAKTVGYEKRVVNLKELLEKAIEKVGKPDPKLKGVKGTTSEAKCFEPLEKGILRSRHGVYLFKDGTIRFDSTNLPITHFKPSEIGTSIEKLRELGYSVYSEEDIVELFPQDIIVSEDAAPYLVRVTKFIDELLEKFYGLEPYYNIDTKEDLVGKLVVGLAPHTSAAILGRIIGFSKARGCYAHPYFHAATRRDCFAYDETLPIFDGMSWQIVKIGEFVENLIEKGQFRTTEFGDIVVEVEGYKTLSLNKDGRYELKTITAFSKHPVHDHVTTIKTKSGREITTSGLHNFIDSKNHVVPAFQSEEVILPRKLDIPTRDVMWIDLLDFSDEDTMIVGIAEKLRRYLKREGVAKTARTLGIHKSTLYNYMVRDSVPLWLVQRVGISIPSDVQIKEKRDTVILPRKIRVGRDFLRLLGFYVAEGHCRKKDKLCYQVDFAVTREKQLVKKVIKNVFGVNASEGKQRVTICSKIIYNLFVGLKAGTHAKNKRVPPFIFSLPLKKVRWFLQGYFEGDGGISKSKTKGASPEVACTSASKMLLRDIEFLLTRFGLVCSWAKDERSMSTGKVAEFYKKRGQMLKWKCYKLRMYGTTAKEFCEKIGFWWPQKKTKAHKIINHHSFKQKRMKYLRNSVVDPVKNIEIKKSPQFLYNLTVKDNHNALVSGITAKQCDGDENAIMLLLDALLNFSKSYLPASRGGRMDAPLVITLVLNPSQVDDQVHEMDIVEKMPLDFYRKSGELLSPSEFDIEIVEKRLGRENQYNGFKYTHETSKIDSGVVRSAYTTLETMDEKVDAQLSLGRRIRAVDEKDEAKRLLNSHFLRDLYGNLRAFGEQKFRCTDCNAKYRRVPLIGKCVRCGGRVILTIAEGSVRKYLEVSKQIANDYGLSDYIIQRLELLEKNIDSVFVNEKSKQYNLTDFL